MGIYIWFLLANNKCTSGYEAVGLIDSQLSTVSIWAKATAQDTPAAASGSEADSPRSAPGEEQTAAAVSTQSISETVKAKNPFQDEKVKYIFFSE